MIAYIKYIIKTSLRFSIGLVCQILFYLKYKEIRMAECTNEEAGVAEPIKSLESLLNWNEEQLSEELQGCLALIPDLPVHIHCEDRPQTLLCHDMKGGYTHDR